MVGFNYEDRVRAYDQTTPWYVTWLGISGIGHTFRDEPKVPFLREVLMYPFLVFASIVTVIFAPAKLLYIFMKFIMFRSSFKEFFVDNWNALLSVADAFWMTFLSPIDAFVNFFLLLPLDIFLWVLQAMSWFLVNLAVLMWIPIKGLEILNGRLYYIALHFIFHFEESQTDILADGIWTIFWIYLAWPFGLIVYYIDYLWMTFGW